jgi:hypothetical integral membrane protein (TIGR02206 family)
MQSNYNLFGPVHILTLLSVPALAVGLARCVRRGLNAAKVRLVLAVALVLSAASWYGYLTLHGWLRFPGTLPLELCDATLVMTVVALLTLKPLAVDLAYYGALAGSTMALLTPDLWEPFPSFSTIQFFVSHGLVVAGVLFLVWTNQGRPRPGSVWRAMLAANVFAAFVGVFNAIFGTNYMYLRAKPANPSLLDHLGPWPWYLLSGEAVAVALFTLLWLPLRRRGHDRGEQRATMMS